MSIDRLCKTPNCGRKAQNGEHCFFHKPKKPLNRGKPMRKEAVKTRSKRVATANEWYALNPPDENGQWECYLRISPHCYGKVGKHTINLEHMDSKARAPEKKYDVANLRAACPNCNQLKGSLSADEAIKRFRR